MDAATAPEKLMLCDLTARFRLPLPRRLTVALALLAAVASAPPLAAQPATRVLFLGNSFTASYDGLAVLAERFAAARGTALSADQIAPPSYTLEDHFDNAAGSRSAVVAGGHDWVVLQEQSTRPITDRPLFERFGRLLAAEARSVGARPMLLLTWSQKTHPEDQGALTAAYCGLADDLEAKVAPAGLAFELAEERRPDLDLYYFDGSHPNPRGTYLAALLVYAQLTGESPLGLPRNPTSAITLPADEASFLQQVAADTLDGERAAGSAAVGRGGDCAFGPPDALVLTGGRFRVEVTWRDFFGGSGVGHPVPQAADTGSFWFFAPGNLELTVKVLDGRPVNGHFWVFFGALSNVAYTVTVTDTVTHRIRVYENPSGHLASVADTAAFLPD
jgi:hypothetical protein